MIFDILLSDYCFQCDATVTLLCEMVVFIGLEMKGLAISAKEWKETSPYSLLACVTVIWE